jgi:hypothetical protein
MLRQTAGRDVSAGSRLTDGFLTLITRQLAEAEASDLADPWQHLPEATKGAQQGQIRSGGANWGLERQRL